MLIFLDVILICFIATWLIVRRTILGHVSKGSTQDMVTMGLGRHLPCKTRAQNRLTDLLNMSTANKEMHIDCRYCRYFLRRQHGNEE